MSSYSAFELSNYISPEFPRRGGAMERPRGKIMACLISKRKAIDGGRKPIASVDWP